MSKPDYRKLEGAQLVEALGNDPEAWATASLQHANIVGGHITHGFLKEWFGMALGVGKLKKAKKPRAPNPQPAAEKKPRAPKPAGERKPRRKKSKE